MGNVFRVHRRPPRTGLELKPDGRAAARGSAVRLAGGYRHRLVVALAAFAFASVAVLGAVVPAAAMGSDQFNPTLESTYSAFDDCVVHVGPVVDPASDGHGYAVIGGGQMICDTQHNFKVVVEEMFSTTGAKGTFSAVSGTDGYGTYNLKFGTPIVETQRICGDGFWFTRITVTDYSAYNPLYWDSIQAHATAIGNSTDGC